MQEIEKNKLTIPIYLNTKIVFDMLATIEDGFAEVKNVQTSKSKNRENDIETNIGSNNLFAFLNVGIHGNHKGNSSNGETVIEERTHTPVSLFQKLKGLLDNEKLINRDITNLSVGDFVEVQGTLKNNPVIDMLSGFKELMALANLFTDNKPKNSRRDNLMANSKFNAQIDGLIKGLQADGKKDIICEANGMSVVLPTDENYFLNNNMSEVTDGNYKILGKVIRICIDDGEISLLRNTVFSKLQLDKMEEFQKMFSDPSLSQFVGDDGIKTVITNPVIMIIPIAIYI
ncbi:MULTISPECIES: DUF6414 family protein [Faecalicoccus]|uniref:Uncharacterized protein n=1 Tax=Faecalicoccus pleomorphus TaxID=1323 RepID=A0A3E3DVJ4_9FIRM|nr:MULTISPECIES: hypothetical protein [Faecalicoccus]MDB7980337.1 hypothetical protein [Faecalicoccus pleomorphus]MDB7982312.1 hypothetical protein [Faecalicoccus pleomorphus]MDB7984355.1 hypothetical protein [Faecalicoccus pleomorphus]MDY5111305.1 hypothetical protein [Faecalicoccus sp.]MDY5233453.1 hypothetical protein [Faecalicoccus sp.]